MQSTIEAIRQREADSLENEKLSLSALTLSDSTTTAGSTTNHEQDIKFLLGKALSDRSFNLNERHVRDRLFQQLELPSNTLTMLNDDQNVLGQGGFGQVKLAIFKGSTKVAIKSIIGRFSGSSDLDAIKNESLMMHYIGAHPNILNCYGYYRDIVNPKELNIVLEYAPYNALSGILYDDEYFPDLSFRLCIGWLSDLANALEHVHSKKVKHRDVKAQNLLVFSNFTVKLCDFGLAKEHFSFIIGNSSRRQASCETVVGTDGFRAPELWSEGALFASDIYSWAMTAYQMLNRKAPSTSLSPTTRLENMKLSIKEDQEMLKWGEIGRNEKNKMQGIAMFESLFEQAADNDYTKRPLTSVLSNELMAISGLLGGDPRLRLNDKDMAYMNRLEQCAKRRFEGHSIESSDNSIIDKGNNSYNTFDGTSAQKRKRENTNDRVVKKNGNPGQSSVQELDSSVSSDNFAKELDLEKTPGKSDLQSDYSRLMKAVEQGNMKSIYKWLWRSDVNATTKTGLTALMIAINSNQHLDVIKWLVDAGANPNARNKENHTPLHLAVMKGNLSVVQYLVKLDGIVINDDIGEMTPLGYAAENGYVEIAKCLLECGASIEYSDREYGATPLMRAVTKGQLKMVRFLIDNGANVTAIDKNQSTVLMFATSGPSLEIVKLLLEESSLRFTVRDILRNSTNREGVSAFAWAVCYGRITIMDYLYNKFPDCIDLLATDLNGETLFHLACRSSSIAAMKWLLDHSYVNFNAMNQNGESALLEGISRNDCEVVKFILDWHATHGITFDKLNVRDNSPRGATALMWALLSDSGLEMAKLLVHYYSNWLNDIDSTNGSTPLMYAASGGNLEGVRWLVEVAQPNINIHAKNKQGKTALLWAIEYGQAEVVHWLVRSAGANVNDVDNDGISAMMYAFLTKRTVSKMPMLACLLEFNVAITAKERKVLDYEMEKDPSLVEFIASHGK